MTPIEQSALRWIVDGDMFSHEEARTVREIVVPILKAAPRSAFETRISHKRQFGVTYVTLDGAVREGKKSISLSLNVQGDARALARLGMPIDAPDRPSRDEGVVKSMTTIMRALTGARRVTGEPHDTSPQRAMHAAMRLWEDTGVDTSAFPRRTLDVVDATPLGTGGLWTVGAVALPNAHGVGENLPPDDDVDLRAGEYVHVVDASHDMCRHGLVMANMRVGTTPGTGNKSIRLAVTARTQHLKRMPIDAVTRLRLEAERPRRERLPGEVLFRRA
jgi:hypothetical protein